MDDACKYDELAWLKIVCSAMTDLTASVNPIA